MSASEHFDYDPYHNEPDEYERVDKLRTDVDSLKSLVASQNTRIGLLETQIKELQHARIHDHNYANLHIQKLEYRIIDLEKAKETSHHGP